MSFAFATLSFPPGAFEGSADITISIPDPTIFVVDLHTSGVNSFSAPVTLRMDYSGFSAAAAHDLLWLDESLEVWVNLGGFDDLTNGIFSRELSHFSGYGLTDGTAGWD